MPARTGVPGTAHPNAVARQRLFRGGSEPGAVPADSPAGDRRGPLPVDQDRRPSRDSTSAQKAASTRPVPWLVGGTQGTGSRLRQAAWRRAVTMRLPLGRAAWWWGKPTSARLVLVRRPTGFGRSGPRWLEQTEGDFDREAAGRARRDRKPSLPRRSGLRHRSGSNGDRGPPHPRFSGTSGHRHGTGSLCARCRYLGAAPSGRRPMAPADSARPWTMTFTRRNGSSGTPAGATAHAGAEQQIPACTHLQVPLRGTCATSR